MSKKNTKSWLKFQGYDKGCAINIWNEINVELIKFVYINMHGIKSFQLGLNLYKVGMNSFHTFPTHCLVLIKTSLELLWVHLYEKFFLEQVAFIIFDFWRNFWSSTLQNYNLSRNGFIPEWNQFIPTRNQIIPTMNEFMGVQVFPYCFGFFLRLPLAKVEKIIWTSTKLKLAKLWEKSNKLLKLGSKM